MTEESDHADEEEVVRLLTLNQNRLQAFIFSLTGDRELTLDMLQATNLVIWRKADTFAPGSNFMAWALSIARYQVMAELKRTSRERKLFSDEFVEEIAFAAESSAADGPMDARRVALAECLKEISERKRHVIWRFYRDRQRIREIAREIGKSVSAVEQILSRTRFALLDCISRRMEG